MVIKIRAGNIALGFVQICLDPCYVSKSNSVDPLRWSLLLCFQDKIAVILFTHESTYLEISILK